MLPVVAIVGRPNVGKSTLFNRLTRSRDALTSSHPGTTRDRLYGRVDFDERHFILIDTGGIAKETDQVTKLINKQVQIAIGDADKVLFLVDATGVSAADKAIARILRKTGKSITVVVNKSENVDPDVSVADAFELGLGNPIAISAAHGQGIAHLVETLFPQPIELDKDISDESTIKLAIVGRPNVGKSTLTNRMLGEERVIVHDQAGTTRDSIFIPLERFDQHYILIDTAGVRKRKNVSQAPEKFSVVKTLQAIEAANVVLYVIDARLGVSEQDLKLLGFILECGKALVIAINKWDGMSNEEREHTKKTIDRHLDFVSFARIHYISALHGSGVGNLFSSIDEAYASATKKLSTPLVTRLLQKAVESHSPPLVKGRRIKLRYAHVGGHNPPRIIIHGNQLGSLPQSYRRFLSHFFQTNLRLHGTPVQIAYKSSKNPYHSKTKK